MNKILFVLSIPFITACSGIPGLTQALDDAVTDEAVGISINKAAIQKETNVKIIVDVTNKE